MRQLRLVRVADDTGDLVLESGDGLDVWTLPVDDALRAAVRTPPPAAVRPVAAPASSGDALTVTPREIQVRVRAGESPEELAASLGVDVVRIARFAAPVVEERRRIGDEARRARAHRPARDGGEAAVVVFGEAVDERFAAHGIVPTDVEWDSHRREDGDWVVVADWAGGEGRHRAEWLFTRSSRMVTPLDETAEDLLSDRPIRPVVPAAPERPVLSAAPPLAPGVVAFPPMPDAHTGPLPRLEEVFDQEAAPEGPRRLPPFVPAAAPAASAPPTASSASAEASAPAAAARVEEPVLERPDLTVDAPPLPLGIVDPTTRPLAPLGGGRRRDDDEDRAARARIPSWDDILLGVRRKDD